MTIADLMQESHQTALDKGWWDDPNRNFPETLALMHSELSEVLEEYRRLGLSPELFIYTVPESEHPDKPEGIAVEFADLLIRVFDNCQKYGVPLEEALRQKMAYNRTRPYRHGNKRC